MGDFEDVFGAGADAVGIIESFSRPNWSEVDEDAAEFSDFADTVFLDARIEAEGYSLYLGDDEAVLAFDRVAKIYGRTYVFDFTAHNPVSSNRRPAFAFTRHRERAGYRVIIDPSTHQTSFTRPGRIVVVSSEDAAKVYSVQSNAPVCKNNWNCITEKHSGWNPAYLDRLDAGDDVVLYGMSLFTIILSANAKFTGWSLAGGFAPILDSTTLFSYHWTGEYKSKEFLNEPPKKPKSRANPSKALKFLRETSPPLPEEVIAKMKGF